MVTYERLATDLVHLNKYGPFDGVYGIPRHGLLCAIIFSNTTDTPLITREELDGNGKYLIVDDSANTGETMNGYYSEFGDRATYGVVYGREDMPAYIKSVTNIEGRRFFEWELFDFRKKIGYDIDGVLCPEYKKTDDYEKFLQETTLLYKPRHKIPLIATSRHERYRDITEKWMASHGIEYKFLSMTTRSNSSNIKKYAAVDKVTACREAKIETFIESTPKLAAAMAKLGINVFCVRDKIFYPGQK